MEIKGDSRMEISKVKLAEWKKSFEAFDPGVKYSREAADLYGFMD